MQHAVLYHPFSLVSRGRSSHEAYLGATWISCAWRQEFRAHLRTPFFRRLGRTAGESLPSPPKELPFPSVSSTRRIYRI